MNNVAILNALENACNPSDRNISLVNENGEVIGTLVSKIPLGIKSLTVTDLSMADFGRFAVTLKSETDIPEISKAISRQRLLVGGVILTDVFSISFQWKGVDYAGKMLTARTLGTSDSPWFLPLPR